MRAGALRHQITLEQPAETIASGDASVAYTTVATVWAQLEGLVGTNRGGLTAEAEYRVRIRHRADVNPRWRLGIAGTNRKLGLLSAVDPDGRGRELVLLAREII
ncbi:MAG TPA: head-tail adaptor protein [Gemmatimonadales bacterium]|nr:head-tail adaptor protein [Gemmatimonadales bacterium]